MTRTRASAALESDSDGNKPAPTRFGGSIESDVTPDSKNFQFSDTLGKYVAYLKSIKRPRVSNSELLDGVDQVSRTIAGCIKLAESALGQTKTHQTPDNLNPQRAQTGDIFVGLDLDSLLPDCVNIAEDTLQARDSKKQKPVGSPRRL